MLTYAEAVAALEAAERFGIHPSLDGIRALTDAMGRPQDAFGSVQVTGTNGKSSTTRMTAALLEAHGVRSGAYTSPELESMTERVEVAGAPVSEDEFAAAVEAAQHAEAAARAAGRIAADAAITQFELLTAAALWLFCARGVDVACLEVGMGGRWDATSVVDPAVAVITGVGLDHVAHLGTTRETIAEDKSQIIKAASTAVLGPGTVGVESVLLRRAEQLGTRPRAVRPFERATPVPEDLTVRYEVLEHPTAPGGETVLRVRGIHADYAGLTLRAPVYQAANAGTSIAAAEAGLGRALEPDAVRSALGGMTFPGRFELVRVTPPLVIDGAHNPQAAAVLADAICDAWPDPSQRPTLLLGILADKDAAGIVEALGPTVGRIAATRSASGRALEPDALAEIISKVRGSRPEVFPDVASALDVLAGASPGARAGMPGLVVSGSITTAGEARRWARERGLGA